MIPVTSGQSDGREQKEVMGRVGLEFTHFVSVGICEGVDLELIKAFQDKLVMCQAFEGETSWS